MIYRSILCATVYNGQVYSQIRGLWKGAPDKKVFAPIHYCSVMDNKSSEGKW